MPHFTEKEVTDMRDEAIALHLFIVHPGKGVRIPINLFRLGRKRTKKLYDILGIRCCVMPCYGEWNTKLSPKVEEVIL